jgi:TonB family protein
MITNNSEKYYANIVDIGVPINIRSASTVEWDNIVDKINPNEQVEVIRFEANGWYYIKKDNIEGYVYGGLLKDNSYPDSYPVVEIMPGEIKVFDRNAKVYKILKQRDRYVVFYEDTDNYYIKSEKGNLIGIKKIDVSLENPQNTTITRIDDSIRDNLEYFASTSKPVIVDTETTVEPLINATEENPKPTNYPPTIVPPVTINQNHYPVDNINGYVQDIKNSIIHNWSPPDGMPGYGSVVVFRIGKDGSLTNIKLLRSSGNKAVDDTSINAVKITAPFRPLPDSYSSNNVDIQLNFDDN